VKRLTGLLFVTVFYSLQLYPQIKFGIKAGGSAILVPLYDITFGAVGIEPLAKWGYGFHAGVSLNIRSDVFFFQPEILFESRKYNYKVENNYDSREVEQTVNCLEVPLLIGARFDIMRICFGPSASIKTGLPTPLVSNPDISSLYDRISPEYQTGFGITIRDRIDFELRYKGYLGRNTEGIEKIGYQTFTLNKSNSSIIISIGVLFGKSGMY
jgi:hypothetical protein